MATPNQIEYAAKTPKAPVGRDKLNLESPLLSMTRRHRAAEERERQRAAACVRRLAPDIADWALEMLGLAEPTPAPVDPDPTERECTRCREPQPLSEFQHPNENRLTSQCQTCRKRYYRPNSTKTRKGAGQ